MNSWMNLFKSKHMRSLLCLTLLLAVASVSVVSAAPGPDPSQSGYIKARSHPLSHHPQP